MQQLLWHLEAIIANENELFKLKASELPGYFMNFSPA
jgi:hypothetical protein